MHLSMCKQLVQMHHQMDKHLFGITLVHIGSRDTGGGGGGTEILHVVAGTGLTGGATSGDATLNVDVGTGANKIVQLDGSGRLPAVDGSQLTGVSTATTIAALTDTTIGTPASGEILYPMAVHGLIKH